MTRRTGGDRRIFSELGRRKTLGDRRKESRKKLEEAVATIKRIWPADFDAERLRGVLTLREEYQLMIYLDEVRKLKRSEIAETLG